MKIGFCAIACAAMTLASGCVVNESKLPAGEKLHVTADVMAGYTEYLHAIAGGGGAFAVSLSGDYYGYYYCTSTRCLGGASGYGPRAVSYCESKGSKCVLFARNDTVLVPYEVRN